MRRTHKSHMNRITLEPGKRGGRPCIRGLRISVCVRVPVVCCMHLHSDGHCQKKAGAEGSMHAILQVLSLSLFEVKPLAELLGARLLNDETEGLLLSFAFSQKSPDSSGSDPNCF